MAGAEKAAGNEANGDEVGNEKLKKSKKKPRTVSVILASDGARDKIMLSRSELNKYDDGSYLWINEDQPETYRRRKSML